jgi:hypothetical protein
LFFANLFGSLQVVDPAKVDRVPVGALSVHPHPGHNLDLAVNLVLYPAQ